ncbi:hypothetical protein HAPAU_10790 [Halalkalicoccus paucihalophilus]|uniref:Uncharacterized protein n=1 Tax=Halalkalicoccus paucihalophilus TaxID=1008153 RepID=A0A151AEB9_9EURY|nr:hypothetical protein [Halalkalicoccus paucihalophilus]KYH25989.1 hypothetical protein HAPAU_10790 [Halalkalicoccus paucihalophilus]
MRSITRQTCYEPTRYPIERFREVLASLSRYDLLLVTIPVAFLLAFVTSNALAIGVHAALVGALAIADAVALNPPRTG